MLLIGEMRRKIKKTYGPKIKGQWVDDMADKQVMAIFNEMKESGRFEKINKKNNSDSGQINLSDLYSEFAEKVG